MIAPLAVPAVFLAESAPQMAQDWRVALIVTFGGLIGLFINQRGGARENTVSEIKEQVVNDHSTNMRDDITEGLRLMQFTVEHVRDLPTKADVRKINHKFDRLDAAHRKLEERFKRAYSEPGD